ncbi:hypothetical protein CcCBS67573_g09760 [Chytriomyces confervae]|uniref:F-box domain-containing protein n=1 Tax=Chytriomyces confervae TaxID=246404 RepID=A0A507DPF0_9FUNG|nr:hypothetical protein CcCBS67573_g09760 [Chytriomyces confervae]
MAPAEANTATLLLILHTIEKMQATMAPAEENAAALSLTLRTLEMMQAAMTAMQQEGKDIKETELYILICQPHLLTQGMPLKVRQQINRNERFYTCFQDIPLTVVIQIFAWIPGPKVLKYLRLSKAINQCLITTQFCVLNLQTTRLQHDIAGLEVDGTWIRVHPHYQIAYARAMPKSVITIRSSCFRPMEKRIPESIICLTAVERICLDNCKIIGSIPDGIGALKNLTDLNLSRNSLTGTLPSSFNLLFALETLNLSDHQLSGEFPTLPSLHALKDLRINTNRFKGPVPTVFGNPQRLTSMNAERNHFSIIPATISQLTGLEYLIISQNPLACEILPEIWNLTHLSSLRMGDCKMFGLLAGVGALQNLWCLDVSNNQFSRELLL